MSVADLMAELEGAGVRLWEQDGRLHFRAPRGVMTDDRRAALRSQRDGVLDHLRVPGAAGTVVAHPEDRYQPFPLTDVQAAYLLGRGDTFAYGGVGCHGYGELEFDDLDPTRLLSAWSALVRRHDMLRTVIDPGGWQQVLADVPEPVVEFVDVRGDGAPRFAAAVAEVRGRLDHRVYRAGEWPLCTLAGTRGDGGAVLHFSVDFLVADFVGIQILLTELQALYTDPASALPVLTVTFRDYLMAERALRSGPRYERDRERWAARIDDLPPAPELPVLGHPGDGPVRFTRHRADLDEAAWAGLLQRAGRHGVSPSVAVLTAYAEVIGRWSRRPRFTIDVTLLNRLPLHPDVDALVGDFTSIDLLGVEPQPSGCLADRARDLQRALWDDLDHRLFGGVEVLRELSRRRGPEAALMPIVFTSAIGLGDASPGGRSGYGISQTPQVWIDCQNVERDGGLGSNWDVRDGVFPPGVVEAMVAAYRILLARMATDDDVWSEHHPVPLPPEQARRRRRYNDTAVGLPETLLHDGVVAQSLRTPDRVAVVDPGGSLTYSELLGRAAMVAGRLRGTGVRPGDLVAVVLDKGCSQVVAVLGVLLAGGAYVPVDTLQPTLRRDAMLTAAGVAVALTSAPLSVGAWPAGTTPLVVDGTGGIAPVPVTLPGRGPDDPAYVIYTSGSSGTPKGVVVSHRAALNTVVDITDRFGVGSADAVLGLANLGFDLSVYDIFGPLAVGGLLVLPDAGRRGDPSHWAELVAEHGVTVWNSVPAQLAMLSDYLAAVPRGDLGSLRLAMLSGDWIPVALPDQVRGRLPGIRLVGLGGATEASIWSIWYPIEEVPPQWRSIPYGAPLTNQTIHVLDPAQLDCPEWTTGELYIGGAGVAVGYLADAERTAHRFVIHPEYGRLYRTGDLGRMLPEGQVEFLGRDDLQVKIRGHRVEPAEIEAAIRSHPAVAGAAVLVHGDPPLERRLAAFAEPAVRAGLPEPSTPGGLAASAAAAGAAAVADVDLDRYAERSRRLDHAARVGMVDALRALGVFTDPGRAHRAEDVADAAGVADRYRRLVRRWVRALREHGVLVEDAAGGLRPAADPVAGEYERAWTAVTELADVGGDPAALLEYFRTSAERLPELLRADADPLPLLFPDGRFELSDALYRDTVFNRWANAAAADVVAGVAARWPHSAALRILEVGAGSGGTTAAVLHALRGPLAAGLVVDYLYTDLSPFFLNEARDRFAEHPYLRYARYDLDGAPRDQGVLPNSVDMVIAGDVLHAGRNVDRTLRGLREVLAPGGWLVAVEMTRDHHQVMASLELLARAGGEPDTADERHASLDTFMSREQWSRRLAAVGAEVELVLPELGGALRELGVDVLAARVKTGRARLDVATLTAHLADRLPDHMVPPDVQLVDALPLTDNGKVDRAGLRAWLPRTTGPPVAGWAGPAESEDDLERRVSAIFAETLRVERVGRDQNFFDLGGDSLLAAQLAGRLLEQVPEAGRLFFDHLLRLVLDRPTVATLVPRLSIGPAAPAPAVAAAGTGLVGFGGPPGAEQVVLVHDGTGTLAAARGLVAALTATMRVSGLVVVDVEEYVGHDPELLLDRVADAYARLLLDGLDGAPVRLVGAGFGGLLACELAGQLAEGGAEVAALVVLGDPAPPFQVADTLLAEWLFAGELGVDPVRAGLPRTDAVESAVRACLATTPGLVPEGGLTAARTDPLAAAATAGFRTLATTDPADRLAAIAGALPRDALGSADRVAGADRLDGALRTFRHSMAAAAGYVPRLYAGDVTLVLPAEESPLRPARSETVALWNGVSLGDVRVEDVPGSTADAVIRLASLVTGRSGSEAAT